MVRNPVTPSGADDITLDLSARLASGAAHELGGLLFAMRLRLEALEMSGLQGNHDLGALAAGLLEMQSVVDGLRLLGARRGTGRLVREKQVSPASWWHRTAHLARYVVPPGVEIEGRVAADVPLDRIDLGRFTEAALLLVADAATGSPVVATELRLVPGGHELAFLVRRTGAGNAGQSLARVRRLVRRGGGRVRATGPADDRWCELVVPIAESAG